MTLGALRTMTADDLCSVLDWRNHPRIRNKMFSQHIISPEEHQAWWDSQSRCNDAVHLIYERDGIAMGRVSFTDIAQQAPTSAQWAFFSAPDAPKGTGSAMELLALNFAFDTLELAQLQCQVLATNQSVIEMHRRFGFVPEAGQPNFERQVNNRPVTVQRFVLTAQGWLAIREPITQNIVHKLETT